VAAAVREHRPDVALIDIRMPPTFTHEGATPSAAMSSPIAWPRVDRIGSGCDGRRRVASSP